MIYYSDKAKCMLMENLPDQNYEAYFYNGVCMCVYVCGNGGEGWVKRILSEDGACEVIAKTR